MSGRRQPVQATTRALEFAVECRACGGPIRPDQWDQLTAESSVARVHTTCVKCGKHWTYTATCLPTPAAAAEALPDRYGRQAQAARKTA